MEAQAAGAASDDDNLALEREKRRKISENCFGHDELRWFMIDGGNWESVWSGELLKEALERDGSRKRNNKPRFVVVSSLTWPTCRSATSNVYKMFELSCVTSQVNRKGHEPVQNTGHRQDDNIYESSPKIQVSVDRG